MTYEDAQKIIYEFRDNESPTEDEEFLYTEALQQMITGTGKPEYMSELASDQPSFFSRPKIRSIIWYLVGSTSLRSSASEEQLAML